MVWGELAYRPIQRGGGWQWADETTAFWRTHQPAAFPTHQPHLIIHSYQTILTTDLIAWQWRSSLFILYARYNLPLGLFCLASKHSRYCRCWAQSTHLRRVKFAWFSKLRSLKLSQAALVPKGFFFRSYFGVFLIRNTANLSIIRYNTLCLLVHR